MGHKIKYAAKFYLKIKNFPYLPTHFFGVTLPETNILFILAYGDVHGNYRVYLAIRAMDHGCYRVYLAIRGCTWLLQGLPGN